MTQYFILNETNIKEQKLTELTYLTAAAEFFYKFDLDDLKAQMKDYKSFKNNSAKTFIKSMQENNLSKFKSELLDTEFTVENGKLFSKK